MHVRFGPLQLVWLVRLYVPTSQEQLYWREAIKVQFDRVPQTGGRSAQRSTTEHEAPISKSPSAAKSVKHSQRRRIEPTLTLKQLIASL